MDFVTVTANVAGQELTLHPLKAIWWGAQQTLLVADLHLGKLGHFRRSGVGVPDKAAAVNWDNIKLLLQQYQPTRVIFLGDLFHSDLTHEWRDLEILLEQYPHIQFDLIVGNHDILPDFIYQQAGLRLFKEVMSEPPFILSHHPLQEVEDGWFNLAGHIHPAVRLEGKARQSLYVACFYFGERQGLLPAFGAFTGTYGIKPNPTDQVFLVLKKEVVVPGK